MPSHIVVIEDDLALQDFYHLLLEAEGYTVTISSSIYEDLSLLAELHPDLIILDMLIDRQQSGWHFLQRLKSSPLTEAIPVIIATASATFAQAWQEFAESWGIPVVFKPFNIDELLALIQQLPLDRSSTL